MNAITCKFGGTSLAEAKIFSQSLAIINNNPARRFIVPSAPGKRTPDDTKITDLLYTWYNLARQHLDASEPQAIIRARFEELARELGVDFPVLEFIGEIAAQATLHDTPAYIVSRGEYLNGRLMAQALGAAFIDPKDYVRFTVDGHLDQETYDVLAEVLGGEGRFVVPGFYGATHAGHYMTFSRGGSDVTGAIVARASHSTLYENWTDVSGFYMADPRIVKNPRHIAEITYKELRELAYMGAQVFHDEAIFPVLEPGIPINIRNTHEPEHAGTLIVPERETDELVCGIAGIRGFTVLGIEKPLMNKERGFLKRVLSVLDDHDVPFEHIATGIDALSIVIRNEDIAYHGQAILEDIERSLRPTLFGIEGGLAIIATVGQGMQGKVGMASRLCAALSRAGIGIRIIDQGSPENNIVVGVDESDYEDAVRAIYEEFAHANVMEPLMLEGAAKVSSNAPA